MKNKLILKAALLTVTGLLFPFLSEAQDVSGEIHSLQSVLDELYDEMIPLCNQLIGVGRGLAGFAALWYIASRIWRHLANAEPIDFYPLFRPFALGIAILLFPHVIGLMNGVLHPTITGTAALVENSNNAIIFLLWKKEEAIKRTPAWQMYVGVDGGGDRDRWYRYTHPEGTEESWLEGIGNDIQFSMAKASYNFRNSIKQWMSEILHILYEAAALCINTIRTFYLIVLAILGPLVFGFAVFDGLQHTLTVWIARYINVYMWLPVANIFGSIIAKIQENMLKIDIGQIEQYGNTFFSSSDTAYLVFLVIGIIGYFTVPSVANYIVHAGGVNTLLYKATNVFGSTAKATVTTVGGQAGGMVTDALGDGRSKVSDSMASHGTTAGYFADNKAGSTGYMHDKLSGKT